MIIDLQHENFGRSVAQVGLAPSELVMGRSVMTEDADGGLEELPSELGGRPRWVVPVAVAGGGLVLAGAVALTMKRGKK